MKIKSSVDEIRARFDADVERFSNLETGQSATMDAPLALDLIAEAVEVSTPEARRLLDVGCGAGNYTLKLLDRLPGLETTLIDLSRPMLERAQQRIRAAGCTTIRAIQTDIRDFDFAADSQCVIVASAVLHHLRNDEEWEAIFDGFYRTLSWGGSVWIFDLVDGATHALRRVKQRRYSEYLVELGGEAYRDKVFAYIDREDSPRSLTYQLDLLRRVGFTDIEVLHKRACFAAFGAIK